MTRVPHATFPGESCFQEWWLAGTPISHIVSDSDGNERAACLTAEAAYAAAKVIHGDEGDDCLPLTVWSHDGRRAATLMKDERGHLTLAGSDHTLRRSK